MLVDYRRERFPLKMFVPVALGLALAAGAGQDPVRLFGAWVAALALVFELRLLDDLLDRDVDRLRGLDRVVVRAESIRPLLLLMLALLILTAAALAAARGAGYFAGFVGLVLMLIAGARTRFLRRRPMLYAMVPTMKYPAIVALLAAPVPGATPLVLLGVYGCFILYELLHDDSCRAAMRGAL